jgi:hypothetical protein
MEIFRRASRANRALNPHASLNRRFGVAAIGALAVLLCSGASTSPSASQSSSGTIGASNGEVVGGAVGIVAGLTAIVVILVEINHSHHTLNGCVFAGPNGLELQTSDSKRYMLEGDAASIKVGDRVKLHGSKVKKAKDTVGDQVFKVEKLNRDYGPCSAAPPPSPST